MSTIEDFILNVIALLIVISIFLGFGYLVNNAQCTAKAKALGYKCEYGLMQGCVVIKDNGEKALLYQMRTY